MCVCVCVCVRACVCTFVCYTVNESARGHGIYIYNHLIIVLYGVNTLVFVLLYEHDVH